MKRLLCPNLPRPDRSVEVPESEATHAIRVLRLRDGDIVEAIDGQGHSALAVLKIRGDSVRLEFSSQGSQSSAASPVLPIVLEIAVLKAEAMEWVVEKSVELGVQTLIPVLTAHTVVQTKNKGPEIFRDRWQKIADQALKQCGRLERLHIELPIHMEELITKVPTNPETPRLWCDEASRSNAPHLMTFFSQSANKIGQIHILVGPEGGWSDLERSLLSRLAHCKPVSLGPLIMRAETAAIFAVSIANGALTTSHIGSEMKA